MLTLFLGTDWVANRDAVLEQISLDVAQEKSGRIYMVPEFISHDAERRLCIAAGDTASRFAEVLSFTRLCRRVSDYLGQRVEECMDNGGRVVAMASAVRQLKSRLKAYASVETKPEFLTGLVDAVDEFKRCCITPDDLMSASKMTQGSLAQKLEELSLILEYYDVLCQNGKKDPCDLMTWLLESLEDSSFAKEHVFYIDGFPDFTRQHMAILEHLICHAEQVTISMNCDTLNSREMAFEKAAETASHIVRFAQRMGIGVEIKTIPGRSDELTQLREKLFQGQTDTKISDDTLCLYRTETIYQECLVTAQKIKELICSGERYRDISVVTTDAAAYHNTIEMVFQRCHIPVYLSGTENILDKSVISTVLTAVETALGGFDQQDVFHYIKSSLSPIPLSLADRMENYATMWMVNGSRWLADWEYHPEGLGREWNADAHEALQELNRGRLIAMEPLVMLRNRFRESVNLGQQVQALYHFLDDIDLQKRLDLLANELSERGDKRNAQILNQLWEILLTALEQMYDALGETCWDSETFTHLLKLLLCQYHVGTIPSVLDAVTVGSVSDMRCQQGNHLFVLGAVEGALPGYTGSTGVLTDQERVALRKLGVPLTGGAFDGLQAEFSEIYGVFCGAEKSVTVSCPGGQPSFVYQRLCRMADESSVDFEISTAVCDSLEAGAYLVRNNAPDVASKLGLGDVYLQMNAKRDHSLGQVSPDKIQKLYGQTLKLSASQADKLADCRLSYFLRYGLRAQENKPATVDPAEFGTYVHAVLENTAREIKEKGGFRSVSMNDTLVIARKYSQEYAIERFSQIDSQRLSYLFQRNGKELEQIVCELWEEMQNSDFEPLDFEVSFGENGVMPAISIRGKTMNAQLRGFVDRVDSWSDGQYTYFRVVDYKTGKKDFDYCDVFNGLGLQMLLYLFALEQEGQVLLGENRVPAGVQYFPARVPLVSADMALTDEQAMKERNKLWKRKGLLLWDEAVLQAMEKGDKVIRLPISRKKDGSISGDLADHRQFALLKAYVFGLLGNMVDDIASGNITANPYTRGSSHNACTFCPYTSVCHMETVENRRNYKAMSSQRFWEEVERQVEKNG